MTKDQRSERSAVKENAKVQPKTFLLRLKEVPFFGLFSESPRHTRTDAAAADTKEDDGEGDEDEYEREGGNTKDVASPLIC